VALVTPNAGNDQSGTYSQTADLARTTAHLSPHGKRPIEKRPLYLHEHIEAQVRNTTVCFSASLTASLMLQCPSRSANRHRKDRPTITTLDLVADRHLGDYYAWERQQGFAKIAANGSNGEDDRLIHNAEIGDDDGPSKRHRTSDSFKQSKQSARLPSKTTQGSSKLGKN
jgi:hypothetical protein